jgi:hypothetical protein
MKLTCSFGALNRPNFAISIPKFEPSNMNNNKRNEVWLSNSSRTESSRIVRCNFSSCMHSLTVTGHVLCRLVDNSLFRVGIH